MLSVCSLKPATGPDIFATLNFHKVDVLLIWCELTGVPDSGRRLVGWYRN